MSSPLGQNRRSKTPNKINNTHTSNTAQRAHYTINTIKNTTMPAFRLIGAFEPLSTNNSRTLSS